MSVGTEGVESGPGGPEASRKKDRKSESEAGLRLNHTMMLLCHRSSLNSTTKGCAVRIALSLFHAR